MAKQQLNTKQTANIKRQNDATNTAPEGARIETGWGVMAVSTTIGVVQEPVTFSTAFTDRPIVVITYGGDALTASGIAYGNGGNTIEGIITAKAHTITNSSFYAYIGKPGGGNFGANGYVWYQWMAIGV